MGERAGAGRLWRKVKNVDSLLSARKLLQEEADNSLLREFELLESCAKDEHLIKSGDTAMDASSQVTLDTRMFGVDGIKTWGGVNGTDPKSSYCVPRIVNNFQE